MQHFNCPHGCKSIMQISDAQLKIHGLHFRDENSRRILVKDDLPVLVGCGYEDYKLMVKSQTDNDDCFREVLDYQPPGTSDLDPHRGPNGGRLEKYVSIPTLHIAFTQQAPVVKRTKKRPLAPLEIPNE